MLLNTPIFAPIQQNRLFFIFQPTNIIQMHRSSIYKCLVLSDQAGGFGFGKNVIFKPLSRKMPGVYQIIQVDDSWQV